MKWECYSLCKDDPKGIHLFSVNLQLAATTVTLAKKLFDHLHKFTGAMKAIALSQLDLNDLTTYSYATYKHGQHWYEAAGRSEIASGERPIDGLISFLKRWSVVNPKALVLIGNNVLRRGDPSLNDSTRMYAGIATEMAFFNEEVYHIVTPATMNAEAIEDAIVDADFGDFVGIIANDVEIPASRELSEQLLRSIVDRVEVVFTSAFDKEGYLIWILDARPDAAVYSP